MSSICSDCDGIIDVAAFGWGVGVVVGSFGSIAVGCLEEAGAVGSGVGDDADTWYLEVMYPEVIYPVEW